MKRYNIINNTLGWFCFLVAAVTYLMTIEPTASFWDCPEFISQGAKLEVGHPPGNPIFMLAARFFVNFAFGDMTKAAMMVNSMSALLSAATILLLFWTVTHLVKRLLVADDAKEVTVPQLIAIMGSGLCGALVYTWSDTFWFSAVEGEVYAFSSFCTALVFWLILKWENRADQPHSDRYLILIAYIIGISIAVHLLNLLCIPAIVLVVYYRKFKDTTARGSLLSLAISFAIVAVILFGLVPGFIEVAQYFELLFVNVFHMSYNIGVLFYAVILVASMVWCVRSLYRQDSARAIRWSVLTTLVLSGIPFIGDSLWIPVIIIGVFALWIFRTRKLPVRILNIGVLSVMVIFAGYSSYALLLIRSAANPPMNQNSPDNVFALGSYLNREQYGESPLLFGQQFTSLPVYEVDDAGYTMPMVNKGHAIYSKKVKTDGTERDEYVQTGTKDSYNWTPTTVFPRMYSRAGDHPKAYLEWIGETPDGLDTREAAPYRTADGEVMRDYTRQVRFPSFAQNMRYFVTYQLTHMYWRYFMWNFAGRQNDLQGNGEANRGNWITGIPVLDNARLGDQSLLPREMGEGNRGHNVFYMLPLLLGVIGLLWQAFYSKRGIEQFWVIFFLFFMTGIAIVLYLNKPPLQPRERDYAFAGSFYAFSIWVGMGVAAIAAIVKSFADKKKTERQRNSVELTGACVAAVIGIAVPLQMVSQTWDDHDRSGRFTARDFGMNYLSSLAPNAIIFTNGDNDTFPLWYAQEVENYRPDVRVVNLSYLTTDWYANQMQMPTDGGMAIDMLATPADYGYDRLQYNYYLNDTTLTANPVEALTSLADLYKNAPEKAEEGSIWKYTNMYIPVDVNKAVEAGVISPDEAAAAESRIVVDLLNDPETEGEQGASLSKVLSLDMLATSVKNGWNRPIYFAMTVPETYYLGLSPYMRQSGLAHQVTPVLNGYNSTGVDTDRMFENVTTKFKWGGIPEAVAKGKPLYLDETTARMVTTHRSALLDLATALYNEGIGALYVGDGEETTTDSIAIAFADDRFAKALATVDLIEEKLPREASPYGFQIGQQLGEVYVRLGAQLKDDAIKQKGLDILENEIMNYAEYDRYVTTLKRTPWRYASLSRIDKYAPTYLLGLIQEFYEGGGDIDALSEKLEKGGFDVSHLVNEAQ